MSNLVLILTDHADDARTLQEVLPQSSDGPFDIEWRRRLDHAIDRLDSDAIDIVLLDFFLPDCSGIETFDAIHGTAPSVPVLTLVSDQETELAREAVQRGAQGYLLRGHFLSALVPQALRNVIQRKRVDDALFMERARATVTLDSISDAIISTDCDALITYMNLAAEQVTGWSKDEAHGRPIVEVLCVIDRSTRKPTANPVAQVIRQNEPLAINVNSVLVRRDNEEIPIEHSTAPIHDRRGRITGAVLVFRKIGPTQVLMATRMTYRPSTMRSPICPIAYCSTTAWRTPLLRPDATHSLAVLFLDLDNFKTINDSLGHSIGEQLLKSVAQRLAACIRASDTVSRYGGDEFIIVLMEEKRTEDALHTADKVLASLASTHNIVQRELYTTASIGISVYPDDGQDAETLVRNADTAMYHAKKQGGNTYQFFNAHMNRLAAERHAIETDLRRALEDQQFVLYYQPKLNLNSESIIGVEALIRWQHPQRGLLLPDDFVPIGEESGLIVPIGRWVMREACRQAKAWKQAGLKEISMAVNVSALELRSHDYLQNVRAILSETAIHPGCLELELTESVLMSNSQSSSEMLQALKDIGVKLTLDHFGTGYSSLSYLQRFPIDALKIDQSFVHGITDDSVGNRIIVTSVIGMNLMHRVIAEGIETRGQFAFLHAQQCEEGQGYYFSPPLDGERCSRLLEAGIQRNS